MKFDQRPQIKNKRPPAMVEIGSQQVEMKSSAAKVLNEVMDSLDAFKGVKMLEALAAIHQHGRDSMKQEIADKVSPRLICRNPPRKRPQNRKASGCLRVRGSSLCCHSRRRRSKNEPNGTASAGGVLRVTYGS
jgi:hypothetical protein